MDELLTLKQIERAYPGVKALSEVSFSVRRGTVHALVGENGAGKSTLIKILSGALAPDRGEMLLDGAPYAPRGPRAAIQAGIGTIYQELNLMPYRSVAQNIALGREPNRAGLLDFASLRARAGEILALLKSGSIPLDAPVENLKISQKQIVEISKALINRSKLLIMDEPTAALNAEEAQALFEIIRTLKSQGVTILYVSHRLNEIFELADAITILRDGKHIRTVPRAEITPDELITAMIGRKLEGAFPPRRKEPGPVVMRAGGLSKAKAFENVSFELRAGEVLAITGLSGSGKTELGKALFGDGRLDAGTITLFNRAYRPAPGLAIQRGVGYVAEDRKAEGVLAEVSVRRNISLPLLPRLANRLGVIDRKKEDRVAAEQVKTLDIKTPSLNQLVRNLSGGNQQKVSLAKWLATDARILILLEPTQGIDVGVKFEFYELIHRFSMDGVGIILISSEIPEILGLAHRILVLYNGKVMAELLGEQATQEQVLRCALGQE